MFTGLKTVVVAVLLLGGASSIWAKPILIKSEQHIEEYQLKNGLKIILAPNEHENKVFMNTIYYTGSLNDPKGKGGLAHLLEHLAFKGTTNVPGAEFQRRLNQHTLNSNATTDYHSTRYINQIRPDAKTIDQVLLLEAERMDQLVLTDALLPAEVAIVRREWEMRMDQPFMLFVDQMFRSAYGNDHLGRTPIGDVEEIQSIQLAELQDYYRKWYAPNNAAIVFSGKFDKKQLLKSIDRHFSPLKARELADDAKVPHLDSTAIQQRDFNIAKGSHYAVHNVYLIGRQPELKAALALAPYLHSFEPSGKLYQHLVSTKKSTAVQSVTWLERDYHLLFLGAIHAAEQPAGTIARLLNTASETEIAFNARELSRAQHLVLNDAEAEQKNAVQFGHRLADTLVNHQGDWQQYFQHLAAVKALTVPVLNQQLREFLVPAHRLQGQFSPTAQNAKHTAKVEVTTEAKSNTSVGSAVPKDIKTYQKETKQYLKEITQLSRKKEAKIQRGTLPSGQQYAFYPTETEDGKSYATLDLGFGDAHSLQQQTEIIELTAFLLLRGSEQYKLADIIDEGIAAQGEASVRRVNNSMRIQISAKHEKFSEYLQFILQLLRQPSFDAHEFDLIRQQTLDHLNRPYSEPSSLAQLVLAEMLEQYPAGDLRYRLDPIWLKKQYQNMMREQILQFYQKFMGAEHAQIAITGQFDPTAMTSLLQNQLANWHSAEAYEAVHTEHWTGPAARRHVQAEAREFGHYQAHLSFAVGEQHPDAAALKVLRHLLSDSQLSSRLGLELRAKQGLIYGFYTRFQLNEGKDVGSWLFGANYRTGDAERISAAVVQVLNQVRQDGIRPDELAAAQADILRKQLLSLENERQLHQRLNVQLRQGQSLKNERAHAQRVAAVTVEEVNRVAQKYFNPAYLVEVMADQYGQPYELN